MCCSTAILVSQVVTMAYIRLLLKKNQMTVTMTLIVLDRFHHRYHHLLILLHRREILQQFRCRTHIHVTQAPPAPVMACLEKKT